MSQNFAVLPRCTEQTLSSVRNWEISPNFRAQKARFFFWFGVGFFFFTSLCRCLALSGAVW